MSIFVLFLTKIIIYIIVKFYLFQLIYKIFYKKNASGDRESWCQLADFIGRIDVHGSEEIVQKYRYDKFSILKNVFMFYLHSVEQYVYCTFFMIVSLVYLVFHYSFIDDCLDAYIVTACLHLLDLSDIDEISSRKQTLFDILPKEEQNSFISQISKVILEKYIKIPNGTYFLFNYAPN